QARAGAAVDVHEHGRVSGPDVRIASLGHPLAELRRERAMRLEKEPSQIGLGRHRRHPTGALRTGTSSRDHYAGPMALEVREARPDEFAEAGAVTVAAYEEFVRPGDANWVAYVDELRDVARRAEHATVLVALSVA